MSTDGRTVVIGIGNPYRRDDGVGPAVVSLLRYRQLGEVELAESDGELGSLIDLWMGASLAVVVDAVRTRPCRPGRIHRLSAHHPAMAGATATSSTHGVELSEAVRLARALDRMPRRLLLFAIEACDTRFGVGLSQAMSTAALAVADEIAELVQLEVAR